MRRLTIGMLTVAVLTLAIIAVHQIAQAQSAAQPAAPGTYYKTYSGTDFSPLDSDDVVRWASGTGGGVWVKSHARPSTPPYLEVRVDLPTGAQVTAVTFYVRNCEGDDAPHLYFGAYGPATGAYAGHIPEFVAPLEDCALTQSIVQTLSPALTVDNAQRVYVIGYTPDAIYVTDQYDANFVGSLLVGARVTYQMPGAFLPVVER